jgi:hypothetical protein
MRTRPESAKGKGAKYESRAESRMEERVEGRIEE